MKSEFRPLVDGISSVLPLPIVALTFCRLMPELQKLGDADKMAVNLLWGCWEAVSELIVSPDVAPRLTRGQRVAALVLTEYFAKAGDWNKIENDIIKHGSQSIPEAVLRSVADRAFAEVRKILFECIEKAKREGRWPPT